ncbi:MAG: ATPase [Fretibacterium sp.]|nr:ATPase [Fretibacterium sp.]
MFGLALLITTCVAFVGGGYWSLKKGRIPAHPERFLRLALGVAFFSLALSAASAFAEGGSAEVSSGLGLGYMGVALSTGLACIGAGVGVGFIGAAALGVISEKPSMFGTTLIYVGLAEGIAIYGLVISLFLLGRL